MSKIVRTVANQLMAFVLVFGLYVIMHGHVTPGGGFQGGAIIASGVVMLMWLLARGRLKSFSGSDAFLWLKAAVPCYLY